MSTVVKLVAALVCLAIAGAGGALVVASLAQDDLPEVVTLQRESAPRAPTPEPTVGRDDRALWPEEARRARAAALHVTGGGTVSELDRSDDPGEAYELEVIKDGREYDIALNLDFRPVPNRRYDD